MSSWMGLHQKNKSKSDIKVMELNKIKRTMARIYFCLSLKNAARTKLHNSYIKLCVCVRVNGVDAEAFVDTIVWVWTKKNGWKFAYKLKLYNATKWNGTSR